MLVSSKVYLFEIEDNTKVIKWNLFAFADKSYHSLYPSADRRNILHDNGKWKIVDT